MKYKVISFFIAQSKYFISILFIFCFISNTQYVHAYSNNKDTQQLTSMEKLGRSRILEKEGKTLYRKGEYDQALIKFNEANSPSFWLYENSPNGFAELYIRRIYFLTGQYQKAWAMISQTAKDRPYNQPFIDEKIMYDALLASKQKNSNEPIYSYINFLRNKYAAKLPPKAYSLSSVANIATILVLYDTIGDHDAGIAFIDEILAYFRTGKAGDPKPGRVDAEYMKIREAFEKDKAEGAKGRATKALIQSDYFPW